MVQSCCAYRKIGPMFISRSIFSPMGFINTFIRITKCNPEDWSSKVYELTFLCILISIIIFIHMKTTLLTIGIMSVAFILMNLSLLIKSKPLEKRCSDEGCECSCGE